MAEFYEDDAAMDKDAWFGGQKAKVLATIEARVKSVRAPLEAEIAALRAKLAEQSPGVCHCGVSLENHSATADHVPFPVKIGSEPGWTGSDEGLLARMRKHAADALHALASRVELDPTIRAFNARWGGGADDVLMDLKIQPPTPAKFIPLTFKVE